jgi:hypothetical protein
MWSAGLPESAPNQPPWIIRKEASKGLIVVDIMSALEPSRCALRLFDQSLGVIDIGAGDLGSATQGSLINFYV